MVNQRYMRQEEHQNNKTNEIYFLTKEDRIIFKAGMDLTLHPQFRGEDRYGFQVLAGQSV